MSAWIGKILSLVAIYLAKYVAELVMKYLEKKQVSEENKKKIKEALALKDRREAARRINEIFKSK